MRSTRALLQNALIFIEDTAGGSAPYPIRGAKFLASDTSISVAAMHEIDGPCRITLGLRADVAPARPPEFEHVIATPSRAIALTMVDRTEILRLDIPEMRTTVAVWVNRLESPDEVVIGVA